MNLDWLNLVAGVGIFLWGMSLIESSLAKLASGRLNHYLSTWTSSGLSSIATGALCTLVVQSSSLVTLIVLALASSKLLNLKQSVGVIFGANLGTTATGWLITLLGFKISLGDFAIYFIGLAALLRVIFAKRIQRDALFSLFISIGLILFSLDVIKSGTMGLSGSFNITELQAQSPLVFVLAGLVLATLVQSSSAVMIMNLGAVHAGIISLENAFALVIGADIGTTSTAILGSIKGARIKKQLALAHVCFNLTNALVAFFVLLPLVSQLLAALSITDSLVSVVAFHSVLNLIGILVYLPLLNYFVRFLSRRFKDHLSPVESRLSLIPVDIPAVAIESLRKETITFSNSVSLFNKKCLHLNLQQQDDYFELKKIEGYFITIAQKLSQKPLTKQQSEALYLLLSAVRDGIYSAKLLKDVKPDLEQAELEKTYRNTEVFPIFNISQCFFDDSRQLFDHSVELEFEGFVTRWKEDLFYHFKTSEHNLLTTQTSQSASIDTISTLLNVNKSLYKSCKYYLQALESIDQTFREQNDES